MPLSAGGESTASGCAASARIVRLGRCDVDVVVSQSSCAGCNGRCLGQLLAKSSSHSVRMMRDQIEYFPEQLRVGDHINLTVSRSTLIGLSLLAYLQPVVLMLLFGWVCYGYLSRADAAIALSMVVGLILGLAVCKLLMDWFSQNTGPRISIAADPGPAASHSRSSP